MRVRKGVTAVLAGGILWLAASAERVEGAEFKLTCGPNRTIGKAIPALRPGDTLYVSGTCNENLVLGPEVAGITLDGQGTATINGNSITHTVTVTGRGITLKRFTITMLDPLPTSTAHAVAVQDGGAAEIDGNTIQDAVKNGIVVFRNSTARIINNTIQNNGTGGINVGHTSSALIGFKGPPGARERAANTIQDNGGEGVQVVRGSSAQVFANTIQNNGSHGVRVDRGSQAEIAACTITGNAGSGILAMRNSGVEIGTDATGATPFDNDTNTGTNYGPGVSCAIDGFVEGRLGGLEGGTSFDASCTNRTEP
jgi:parallel beta-helix repeat protein